MNKPIHLALLSLLFLSFRPALADPASSALSPAFRVGVIQSLTGIAAEDGNTVVRALRLAAKELNKDGQGKIELFIEDDGTDAKQAVSAYKNLQARGADVIIGPTWSFTANSVIPLAARDKVPLMNTSTIPECLELEKSDGFGFSTAMSVKEHAQLFEQYLTARPARTSIIIYTNNSWGEAQRVHLREALIKHRAGILREIPSVNFDTNDWRASLPSIKALQPNLWVLLVNKADLDTILRQIRALGVKTPVFASYHFEDTLRLHNNDKTYGDVCYSRTFQPTTGEENFAAKFQAEYGIPPQAFADNTYDTLFLLSQAFREAKARRLSLRDSLRVASVRGVAGYYRFDPSSSFSIGKGTLVCVGDR